MQRGQYGYLTSHPVIPCSSMERAGDFYSLGWRFESVQGNMVTAIDFYYWGDSGHYCNERCICPIHKTPMIYSPALNLHACQDINCILGHGFEEQYMTNRGRRKVDKTDAEGTVRLPHIQKALDAGLLKSPPVGDMAPKGRWGKTKKKRKKKK